MTTTKTLAVCAVVGAATLVALSASFPLGPLLGAAQVSSSPALTNEFWLHAEGTGTQAGYSDTGSVDWDESTVFKSGTNAFEANDSTAARYTVTTFTSRSNLTVVGWVRRNNVSSTQRKVFWLTSGGVNRYVLEQASGGFRLSHGSATVTVGTTAGGQWYGIKLSVEAGSGSDGRAYLVVCTNSMDFSTGASNVITTGTTTANIDTALWGHDANLGGNSFYYDDWFARMGWDSIQGDNPTP